MLEQMKKSLDGIKLEDLPLTIVEDTKNFKMSFDKLYNDQIWGNNLAHWVAPLGKELKKNETNHR